MEILHVSLVVSMKLVIIYLQLTLQLKHFIIVLLDLTIFLSQGTKLNGLWSVDACIPLKDQFLVELIRGVVCWCLWLVRKNISFKQSRKSTYQAISLAYFWCKARHESCFLKLSIMLPLEVQGLSCQAEVLAIGNQLVEEEAHSLAEVD
jgi:hypothetical protein